MDSFGSNIRVLRVQTRTDTSIGTSHLGDVDRSNVSSISQTSREKENEKRERQRERKTETEGESASEKARRGGVGFDKSQGNREVFPQYGFTERYDLCSLPSIILRQI